MADQVEENKKKIDSMSSDLVELKTTMNYTNALITRLDNAIEKMSEVSAHISKLLNVHENKIGIQDQNILNLDRKFLDIKDELKAASENSSAQRDKNLKYIHDEFSTIRGLFEKHDAKFEKYNARLLLLEKWKYGVVAAAGVIGFLLNKIPLEIFPIIG